MRSIKALNHITESFCVEVIHDLTRKHLIAQRHKIMPLYERKNLKHLGIDRQGFVLPIFFAFARTRKKPADDKRDKRQNGYQPTHEPSQRDIVMLLPGVLELLAA